MLGCTLSNGAVWARCVKDNFTAEDYAAMLRTDLGPFLQRKFPEHTRIRLITDGEALLHAPPAQREYSNFGIVRLGPWPKGSPDLNPQENVWAWAEKKLRELENVNDSLTAFKQKCTRATKAYPKASAVRLAESMTRRVKKVIEMKGAMTKY